MRAKVHDDVQGNHVPYQGQTEHSFPMNLGRGTNVFHHQVLVLDALVNLKRLGGLDHLLQHERGRETRAVLDLRPGAGLVAQQPV